MNANLKELADTLVEALGVGTVATDQILAESILLASYKIGFEEGKRQWQLDVVKELAASIRARMKTHDEPAENDGQT